MQEIFPSQHLAKPSHLRPNCIGDTTRIARSSMVPRPMVNLSLLGVWHDGWEVWMASAASILAIAIFGLAGPFIAIVCLSAGLGLDDYVHVSSQLITYQGLALLTLPNKQAFHLLLAQAALGAIFAIGAHVGIVCLALRRHLPIPLSHVWRALPTIFFGLFSRGVLLAVPVMAINLPLSGTAFDLNNLGRKAYSAQGLSQIVLLRTFNDLIPVPGSPFTEFLPVWRQTLSWPSQTDDYSQHLADQYGLAVSGMAARHQERHEDSILLRITFIVACAAAASTLEPLFRFHTIGTLYAAFTGNIPFSGYLRALAIGFRHFGRTFAHIWGLRLAGCALMLLFITIPQVIHEGGVIAGIVRHTLTGLNLYACGPIAFAIAGFILTGVLTSFAIICDVQLYSKLANWPQWSRINSVSSTASL